MKRDMDLVRRTLMDVEACEEADGRPGHLTLDIEGHSPEEVMYHVQLLAEAGLMEVRDQSNLSDYNPPPSMNTKTSGISSSLPIVASEVKHA